MYLAVQWGALVTNTGSGEGCGASWPLCKGTFMPEWDYAAIIEFGHRMISGLAGLGALVLAVWVWRALPHRPLVRGLAVGGLLLTIFQGLLGAANVLWPQTPPVLALHFGISLLCFSAVLLTAVLILREGRAETPGKPGETEAGGSVSGPAVPGVLARWVWTVLLFTYGVTYLGALVRHLDAALACLGWPLCNGQLVPTLYGPVGANFAHRVGAGLVIIMVVRLAVLARRHAAHRPGLVRTADWALGLVVLQALEGALMPLGSFNLLTQMGHSAIITLFWGALSYLCLEVLPAGVLEGARTGRAPARGTVTSA